MQGVQAHSAARPPLKTLLYATAGLGARCQCERSAEPRCRGAPRKDSLRRRGRGPEAMSRLIGLATKRCAPCEGGAVAVLSAADANRLRNQACPLARLWQAARAWGWRDVPSCEAPARVAGSALLRAQLVRTIFVRCIFRTHAAANCGPVRHKEYAFAQRAMSLSPKRGLCGSEVS